MTPTQALRRDRQPHLRAVLAAGLAALLAVLISAQFALLGPLLVALVLGAIVANTRMGSLTFFGNQPQATKLLLRAGVVLLGLKLPAQEIVALGVPGLVTVVLTVGITYSATVHLGDRLGLDRGFVTLLAAGFSICGAAAIAAVDDTVRAKERFVALAVALVTVFGSAMIVLVPWVGNLLGLSTSQTAIWAGASIHEVAQVVAAASIVGPGAVALATTIKLGRVALLAPMYSVASRRGEHGPRTGAPLIPWFVVGFALAVAVRSFEVLPAAALRPAGTATTLLLAGGMFGLGMGIRAKEIWPVPMRAFVLACTSTLIAAGTSLMLILVLC